MRHGQFIRPSIATFGAFTHQTGSQDDKAPLRFANQMTDYQPALDVLNDFKLQGAYWCQRRHRWCVRLRYQDTHPGSPQTVLCRTAPEAAAYANAGFRALREFPDDRSNDFFKLFRGTRECEGPEKVGSRIMMIQPPFCWVKVSHDPSWLLYEEWFVDPRTERVAKVRLIEEDQKWVWKLDFLDEFIWRAMRKTGTPLHRNGDLLDCRVDNLIGEKESRNSLLKIPLRAIQPGQEATAYARLNLHYTALLRNEPDRAYDPWNELYEEGDRRWLVELAGRWISDMLDSPLWKGREELIRLLSRPWTIAWGTRRGRRSL